MAKPFPEVGQRWRNVKSGRVSTVTSVHHSTFRLTLTGESGGGHYGQRDLYLFSLHENYRIEEEAG